MADWMRSRTPDAPDGRAARAGRPVPVPGLGRVELRDRHGAHRRRRLERERRLRPEPAAVGRVERRDGHADHRRSTRPDLPTAAHIVEMDVWSVDRPGPLEQRPLRAQSRPVPSPGGPRSACGSPRAGCAAPTCTSPPATSRSTVAGVVPGHEIVGYVDALGADAGGSSSVSGSASPGCGSTCGACRFCSTGRENLCVAPRFTGLGRRRRVRRVRGRPRGLRLPAARRSSTTSRPPRCCAPASSATGRSTAPLVPTGGRLGIYGFGGSAHLAAQLAIHRGATVHVLTRSAAARALALELGCASAGHADRRATRAARRGDPVRTGRRARAGRAPGPRPRRHAGDRRDPPVATSRRSTTTSELFQERQVRSVTANTRLDGERFLREAADAGVRVHTVAVPVRGRRPGARSTCGTTRSTAPPCSSVQAQVQNFCSIRPVSTSYRKPPTETVAGISGCVRTLRDVLVQRGELVGDHAERLPRRVLPAGLADPSRSSFSVYVAIMHRVCGTTRMRSTPSRCTPSTSASSAAWSPDRPGCGRSWRRPVGARASRSGSMRESMHVTTATPAWATPSNPLSANDSANARFAASRSSKSPATTRTLGNPTPAPYVGPAVARHIRQSCHTQ